MNGLVLKFNVKGQFLKFNREVRSECRGGKISENEEGVLHGEEVQVTGRDGLSKLQRAGRRQTRKTFKLTLQEGLRMLEIYFRLQRLFQ